MDEDIELSFVNHTHTKYGRIYGEVSLDKHSMNVLRAIKDDCPSILPLVIDAFCESIRTKLEQEL